MMEAKIPAIRVLIIDDHPVVRYGVKHMLGAEADIDVVGELDNLSCISTVIPKMEPDVILLDLELGETNGIESLQRLRETLPAIRVVVYTSHDEEENIIQAVQLGVEGYLLKGCSREKIVSAIHRVHNGGTALESSVASKLMHHMHKHSPKNEQPAMQLSKREQQVLELLAKGKTNRGIGETLFISESTVKFHVHALLSKLDANNRTEAVSIAANLDLIDMAMGETSRVTSASDRSVVN